LAYSRQLAKFISGGRVQVDGAGRRGASDRASVGRRRYGVSTSGYEHFLAIRQGRREVHPFRIAIGRHAARGSDGVVDSVALVEYVDAWTLHASRDVDLDGRVPRRTRPRRFRCRN
ncbi:MAG: hypothetical protein M3024_09995, partial [Candidatus Dormibacteraeota bacterium]|nr:hypothetical protein [Candidatus Dormibacteraeota bacterium]